jgi:hypothetical protein
MKSFSFYSIHQIKLTVNQVIKHILLYLILPVLLIGCDLQTITPHTSPEVKETSTTTLFVATPTNKPTSTPSSSPTLTGTPTQAATRTPTPAPTLPPEEVKAWIEEMLMTNGGCELPCWWGIEPGKTTFTEAIRHFNPYASKISSREQDAETSAGIYFFTNTEGIGLSRFIYIGFHVHNGIIEKIRVMGIQDLNEYKLPNILEKFEIPTEIYVWAYSPLAVSGDQIQPLRVDLFYPDRGILIIYSAEGETKGDVTQGCIDNGPSYFLWNSMLDLSFTQAMQEAGFQLDLPPLPVEQALGMSPEMFYQRYKGDNKAVCIETPANIWQWWVTPTP